jgi:hypothetical protein
MSSLSLSILFINKFTFQLVDQFLSHFLSEVFSLQFPLLIRFCVPDAVRPAVAQC